MALLKIARMGHPVLHQIAEPVSDPTSREIRHLIRDMLDTMVDANGAGLAAPQVHHPLRLFVYRVPANRVSDPEQALLPRVLINPEITPLGEEMMVCGEGCLSIPDLRGDVLRHAKVHYRGVDENGEEVEGEAVGFHANVLQHENDHLDGILYPQRIEDFSRFGYVEEIVR
ncbi:peptide deformylase [Gluconobacter cerinus]|uniref:Peptide deformylase n=1 Tax=Gluconobacter cerinus TaxID=38307 RepID=A0AAV5N9X2_9PROT|nr:peptide deformylase [Gluconobacter cerinus]GBR02221.1 peptide deformylase [Gluconobacter cerinus NRIC 0229]GLQ61283.1 peptide deformylase [Gluconobacter cerinus]